jgi:putative ABC transport system permease protein
MSGDSDSDPDSGDADGPGADATRPAERGVDAASDGDDDGSRGPLERLSRRFPAVMMARRNLSRNRLRSGLAVLGIIIGVLAIASLGMFGTTLRTGATQNLGDIGNEIQITPNLQEGIESLTDRDVTRIERVARGEVVPLNSDQRRLTRGRDSTVVTAYAMENPGALYQARNGRVPERLQQGILVGSFVADRFDLVPGNTVTLDGESYRVTAVLREQDGISLVNPNNAVVVPADAIDEEGYSQVVVSADSGEEANETAVAVREALNRRETRVNIFELGSITQGINTFFGILNAFLVGIGSISLVVAGVSILNVMLMSTVERRGEIGVLRAVGVQRGDVIRMILAEAGLLGAAGGAVGAVLAVGAGVALNWYVLSDPLATFRPINLAYVALAFGFALVTSVLSGLYPAWKAANEHPVEALRN